MLLFRVVIFIGALQVVANKCTTSVDSGKCESICNITETSKEPSQLELELCKPSFDKDHTQLHIYFTASKYEKFTLQSVISSDIGCHYGIIYVIINNSTINTIPAKAIPQSVVNEQTCSVNYKTIEFNGNTFRKVETNSFMREVKLYNNKLEILGQITEYNPDKTDLYLSKANIKQVDKVFLNFPKLIILSLAGNNIETINRAFVDIPYLKQLDLSSNNMKVIDINTFAGLTKLEDLNLSDNQISSITNAFQVTKGLTTLSLSSNKLSQINFKAFSELSNLKYLDLSHNQISVLNHAFSYLTNLIKLNLSHNLIKRGDYDTFTGLSKLIFLDLSHNEIITLDEKLPINIPMVDIRYNKLDTLNTALLNDLIQMKKDSSTGGNKLRTTEKSPSLTTTTKYVPEIPFEALGPAPTTEELTVGTEVGSAMVKSNPNSEYKVVCYFTNWASYRQDESKFLPSDIDSYFCSHIVYAFAILDEDEGIIKPQDNFADIYNKFYEMVTANKAKGVKVMISIGGWNDSAGDKYSKLVNNPSARKKFISHVVDFIGMHDFDGLDLQWKYPKCWQADCSKGPKSDKAAFAALVRELSDVFKPKGWLLSAAVSPISSIIDAGYDAPVLSQYLDWMAVMAYDYHGQWEKVTGHVAPLYALPEDFDVTYNVNASINYWIGKGADPKKLLLGMPISGASFSLASNNDHSLNAPTKEGGEGARSSFFYFEICQNIKQKGWKVVHDRKGRIGPYAYFGDQWVSFDDRDTIRHKSEYIKSMGLGGGMIWSLDMDDFRNLCNCESYPLLKTINRVLRNYTQPEPQCVLE